MGLRHRGYLDESGSRPRAVNYTQIRIAPKGKDPTKFSLGYEGKHLLKKLSSGVMDKRYDYWVQYSPLNIQRITDPGKIRIDFSKHPSEMT